MKLISSFVILVGLIGMTANLGVIHDISVSTYYSSQLSTAKSATSERVPPQKNDSSALIYAEYGEQDPFVPIEGNIVKGTYKNGEYIEAASRICTESIQRFKNPTRIIISDEYYLRASFFSDSGEALYEINGVKGALYVYAGTNAYLSIYREGSPAFSENDDWKEIFNANLKILSFEEYQRQKAIQNQNAFSSISIFQKIGVCGDSFASGSIYYPDKTGWTGNSEMSWPKILGRKAGAEVQCFSKGGLATRDWLTEQAYGLPKLLKSSPKDLYILSFGINDYKQVFGQDKTLPLGSEEDFREKYTDNPESFFGCYGKIINSIQEYSPDSKIVVLSVARPWERKMDEYIERIADYFNLPYIYLPNDDYFISPDFYTKMIENHPTAVGYGAMANAIEKLIMIDMSKNNEYWETFYGV